MAVAAGVFIQILLVVILGRIVVFKLLNLDDNGLLVPCANLVRDLVYYIEVGGVGIVYAGAVGYADVAALLIEGGGVDNDIVFF